MKPVLILIVLLLALNFKSQDLMSSNTSIESCLDEEDCFTINNTSLMFYDETRNEFYLKIDFSNFRSENNKDNAWVNDMLDSTLYFKAILPVEQFPDQGTQNTKSFLVNCEIFFNEHIQQQRVEITIFSTENSIVVSGGGNLKYDAYKVNFSIPVIAKDFKVYKKMIYINQTIAVNVTMGRINLFRPEMEFHLKEIYYKATH